MKVQKLNETRASRLYRDFTDDAYRCAIISGFVSDEHTTEEENLKHLSDLKAEVRHRGYGFSQFISRWVDNSNNAFDEQAVLIGGIGKEEAMELGAKYQQYSIVYKDSDGCFEICTRPFSNYEVGDIVRKFNVKGNKVLNIDLAREIFSRRAGGAVSMPVKGDHRPFTLKEVPNIKVESYSLEEVIQPRPSYFQTECRYEKVF